MKLLTAELRNRLVKNFHTNSSGNTDFVPVVKFFDPCGSATWLITELNPETDVMFGLCDLGMGCPEVGAVSLNELKSVRNGFGLGIERDLHFRPTKTLNEYAKEAYEVGGIVA